MKVSDIVTEYFASKAALRELSWTASEDEAMHYARRYIDAESALLALAESALLALQEVNKS